MAYLRYYRYRGDPGLFSGIGKLVGKLIPAAAGFIPGVGGVFSKIAGKVLGRAGKAAGAVAPDLGEYAGLAKGAVKAVGGALATGAAFGVGGQIIDRIAGGGGGRASGGRSYRRMNVGNVRALRRSMRRVEGFAKLAKSTISFTHTTRMKKRGRKR